MAIPTDVASLAVSVVAGALKLGKRLDEIQAEEAALRSAIGLAFPQVALNPSDTALRKALRKLSRDTRDADPDPLGDDRAAIAQLLNQSGVGDELYAMASRYGLLETLESPVFKPDEAFTEALRARSGAWDLDDAQIRDFTFFVAAGADLRGNSLGFRIGATVLDVLTEVAAQNTRYVISHAPTRKIIEGVLVRFSEPDLAAMSGWNEVLSQALRTTLSIVVDERQALAGSREWLERALSSVARARDLADNGDDFVVGLFQGRGMHQLLRSVLTEGADYLSDGDAQVWESILSDVLIGAAAAAEDSRGFETFFQENWHTLVGAGFASLAEHGPRLLRDDEEILKVTLVAAVNALAESFDDGVPNGHTFAAVTEAAIAVFADPGVLAESVREDWLRELISATAGVVADRGLRRSFSQPSLEAYARATLKVLARHPDLLAEDSNLAQALLRDVLGSMAAAQTFGVGPLADVAVEAALTAIAENPALISRNYPATLGQLAGGLAERVARGGIRALQAEALIGEIAEVVATNERLFLEARAGIAEVVVDAVLDAAEDDAAGLLAGGALVAALRRVLDVVAVRGRTLPADLTLVAERVGAITTAGLAESRRLLGRQLAQEDVPEALAGLIALLAGDTGMPAPGSSDFRALFAAIAEDLDVRPA